MSDPADLINRAIEALRGARIDLPAFSTLDRLVNRLRGRVHERMYERVAARLTAENRAALDALLTVPPDEPPRPSTASSRRPGRRAPKRSRLWIDRLDWLAGLLDPGPLLEGIAHTKLRQFAAEAAALELGELLDMTRRGQTAHPAAQPAPPGPHRAAATNWSRCCSAASGAPRRRPRRGSTPCRTQHRGHRGAPDRPSSDRCSPRHKREEADAAFGRDVRTLLTEQGGIDRLAEQCETVIRLARQQRSAAALAHPCPDTEACCSGCST